MADQPSPGPEGATTGSWPGAVAFDSERAVVRPVANGHGGRVFVVGLVPGQQLAEHPAPGPLCLLVVEGAARIMVEGAVHDCVTGGCALMGPGARHSLLALGGQRAVVVGVLGPS